MRVIPYGGAKRVTGSCFYVEVRDVRLLIDCGMFQGEDEEKNYQPFTFDPKKLDYVILTHALRLSTLAPHPLRADSPCCKEV